MATSPLLGLGPDYKIGGRSVMEAGLVGQGFDQVLENLRMWGALTVYVTSFTSRKVANSVFMSALRHVPEDTAELMDSGFVDSLEGRTESLQFTVNIAENLEGTPDYAAIQPNFQTAFSQMDYFGTRMRTFSKYVVGFDAPHAAVVHETTPEGGYRQPSEGTRTLGHAMRFPDQKTSHYLLNAFNAHRDKFSGAMINNMQGLAKEFERHVAARSGPRNLGTSGIKPGLPRLVKR